MTESLNPEHQLVMVKWADAHAGPGHWDTLDPEDTEEHIVVTVGLMVTQAEGGKPKHLTIAQSKTPDDFYDHIIHIPQGMVRSICFLQSFSTEILV
jgi:hypothetical protein